jgi:hypothetical protein
MCRAIGFGTSVGRALPCPYGYAGMRTIRVVGAKFCTPIALTPTPLPHGEGFRQTRPYRRKRRGGSDVQGDRVWHVCAQGIAVPLRVRGDA